MLCSTSLLINLVEVTEIFWQTLYSIFWQMPRGQWTRFPRFNGIGGYLGWMLVLNVKSIPAHIYFTYKQTRGRGKIIYIHIPYLNKKSEKVKKYYLVNFFICYYFFSNFFLFYPSPMHAMYREEEGRN